MRNMLVFGFIGTFLMGHSSASADLKEIKNCISALVTSEPRPVLHIAEAQKQYDRFLKLRETHPQVIPPAYEVTKETTLHEKFFSFFYWWLPGNIWNEVLRTQYSGAHMYRPYLRNGGQPLKLSDMPTPDVEDASLNVPQNLPTPPPGKLSYRLKTQAENQYKIYRRDYKNDHSTIPKIQRAKDDTPPEEIYYAFPFWWYPENVYHDKVAGHHGDLAATIFAEHVFSGYKFPAPPVFRDGSVIDVPATEIQGSSPDPGTIFGTNSPESGALDNSVMGIDGSDGAGPNSADSGPAGSP